MTQLGDATNWLVQLCGTLFLLRIITAILQGINVDAGKWLPALINSRRRRRITSSCKINNLPPECLQIIFGYLHYTDLMRCRRVSDQWQALVDCHKLWNHADFRQVRTSERDLDSKKIPYKDYIQYLKNTSPKVTNLTFDVTSSIPEILRYDNAEVLSDFLSHQSACQIKKVKLTWASSWEDIDSVDFQCAWVLSLTALMTFSIRCPGIQQLSMQFNWTSESISSLLALKELKKLELTCMPTVQGIQKWHINKILEDLPLLRTFRLIAKLLPQHAVLQKFTVYSDKLEELDLSDSVNFTVSDLYLPQLLHLKGKDLNNHCRKEDCIFPIISKGCPKLQMINRAIINIKHKDFGLSKSQQMALRVCRCELHDQRKVTHSN